MKPIYCKYICSSCYGDTILASHLWHRRENRFIMGSLTPSHHKLPIIDFTDQLENTTPSSADSSWLMKCKNVTNALEDYGCFIGVFDTVSAELDTAVFGALKDLFDLPTETKIQNKSAKPLYGYVGQIPFIPLYESLGIDFSNTPQGIQSFTDVMWPEGNEDFRYNSILSYHYSYRRSRDCLCGFPFIFLDIGLISCTPYIVHHPT